MDRAGPPGSQTGRSGHIGSWGINCNMTIWILWGKLTVTQLSENSVQRSPRSDASAESAPCCQLQRRSAADLPLRAPNRTSSHPGSLDMLRHPKTQSSFLRLAWSSRLQDVAFIMHNFSRVHFGQKSATQGRAHSDWIGPGKATSAWGAPRPLPLLQPLPGGPHLSMEGFLLT